MARFSQRLASAFMRGVGGSHSRRDAIAAVLLLRSAVREWTERARSSP